MKAFAIGDLHLSGAVNKPMNVFGPNWNEHFLRIQNAWREKVGPEDIVMIPGDISWAMNLKEAKVDLDAIAALPGNKIILRGNHDYWWNSLTQVRGLLDKNMYAVQNDSVVFSDVVIGGTRGWICPGSAVYTDEHEKIYNRELLRLELSLKSMPEDKKKIVMLHYPPCNERRQVSGFMKLIEEYHVDTVVYGHLHGKSSRGALDGVYRGVRYVLSSADYVNFEPREIL